MALADKMSDYLENKLTDHWLAGNSYSPPTNVFLGIGDTPEPSDSDETSWSSEFTGTGYQRQQLAFHKARSFLTNQTVSFMSEEIEFTAGGNWGTARCFTIWDAQTGGKLLFRGTLRDAVDMTSSGKKLNIQKENLSVVLESNAYSTYLREKLLDHVLRADSYAIPNKYVALTFTLPDLSQSAAELDEPQVGNYDRVLKNDWTVTNNEGTNDTDVTFPTATDDYEDFVRCGALADQRSGGNLLTVSLLELPTGGVGAQPPGHEILDTDTPKIYANNVEVYLY